MGADRIDAAFAVYLVNRNRAEVLYEQIRRIRSPGKLAIFAPFTRNSILLTVPLLPSPPQTLE
jgi:hypothetical protein